MSTAHHIGFDPPFVVVVAAAAAAVLSAVVASLLLALYFVFSGRYTFIICEGNISGLNLYWGN